MGHRKNKAKSRPLSFAQLAWGACQLIPSGRVSTYRALASFIKHPGAWRAVGTALRRNPFAPAVPCHRVICADGYIGGLNRGTAAKARLLRAEGIAIKKNKIVLSRYQFRWPREWRAGDKSVFWRN